MGEFESLPYVVDFQQTFGIYTAETLSIPPSQVQLMRQHLIGEETSELAMGLALGDMVEVFDALCDLQYVVDGTYAAMGLGKPGWDRIRFIPRDTNIPERPKIPSGEICARIVSKLNAEVGQLGFQWILGDLLKATLNLNAIQFEVWYAFAVCGLDAVRQAGFLEVHRSNMSKLGDDGRPVVNAVGRVQKGPNFTLPDLRGILVGAFGEEFAS